jgi:hypothetical protein
MVVSVSAEKCEEEAFIIDLPLDGEWEIDYCEYDGFYITVYFFTSDSGWTDVEIWTVDEDAKDFYNYIRADISGECNATGATLERMAIDGADGFYVCDKHYGELYEYEGSYHDFYAFTYTNEYGYYFEIGSNAEGGELAESEFDLAMAAIMNMDLVGEPGETESDSENDKASSNGSDTKTEEESVEKSNDTVIVVAIVVAGVVVIALGVTAIVVFGKKKKQ